jgi:hypothetical protein
MNENNKSFYPSDMSEFIHHPKYGCHDLKGLAIGTQLTVPTNFLATYIFLLMIFLKF